MEKQLTPAEKFLLSLYATFSIGRMEDRKKEPLSYVKIVPDVRISTKLISMQ